MLYERQRQILRELTDGVLMLGVVAEHFKHKLLAGRRLTIALKAKTIPLGFYPVSTDGLIKAENFRSRRATLRRMRGLWNRSM